MKTRLLTLCFSIFLMSGAFALDYREARDRAYFLTDKMAYELDLTPEQYDRAYEINLEYFLALRGPADIDGYYWIYRDADLRCVLFDWQYGLYCTLDYFFRPVRWIASAWYYPVAVRYRVGYYYYGRPRPYHSYMGGTWRCRSRHAPSPYYGMHFRPGGGMRGYYDRGYSRPHHGSGGHRPPKPDHRHDGGARPDAGGGHRGHQPDRPQADRPHSGASGTSGARPDGGRPSTRPGASSSTSRPGSSGTSTRPGSSSGGNRRGGSSTMRGEGGKTSSGSGLRRGSSATSASPSMPRRSSSNSSLRSGSRTSGTSRSGANLRRESAAPRKVNGR